jgi:hypothetical protein
VHNNYSSYGGGYGGHYYGGYGYGYHPMDDMLTGMMIGSMMSSHHNYGGGYNSGATAVQIEQAKQDQRIEDKLDALKEDQNRLAYNNSPMVQTGQTVAALPVAQPQCFLPQDAPLMMNTSFYCQPQK